MILDALGYREAASGKQIILAIKDLIQKLTQQTHFNHECFLKKVVPLILCFRLCST